jgi:hypothetical protein
VTRQIGVPAAGSAVTGRAVERFRVQIRDVLGFRVFSRGDEDKMISWLAEEVCPSKLNEDRQREAVLARCRAEKIEPPGRMSRIIGSANRIADERFCAVTVSRLSAEVAQSLWALIAEAGEPDDEDEDRPSFFTELKADPGKLGLETLLAEITKLKRVRAIGLPPDLFTDVAERRVARWRARCAVVFPSTLRRDHTPPVMLTLLAVLCCCRLTEVTDSLVELFIDLVRAINTRAERRVDKAQIAEFRRVGDKENVMFKVADVSLARPDEPVRDVVYPAVGEQTLKDLVAEAKATESRRRAQVRTVLTGSYSHYYRQMLPKLLEALEFRCNNTAYRPVMDAVELLHRYKDRDGRFTHYERADRVPLDGVVKAEWRAAVVDERGRVERVSYELCVLGALRDALRRAAIWVVGARAWRNPETYLPADFDLHRDVHYEAIAQPTDPTEFVSSLRIRLDTSLARWAEAMRAGTSGAKVGTRKNQVWITVSKAGAQPPPDHLDAIKDEITSRWGVVSLLDLLKEADWVTGLHTEFTTIATRERLSPGQLRKRLLLILFALGTNIGIKRIVHSGAHGVTEAQLRGTRRNYITRDGPGSSVLRSSRSRTRTTAIGRLGPLRSANTRARSAIATRVSSIAAGVARTGDACQCPEDDEYVEVGPVGGHVPACRAGQDQSQEVLSVIRFVSARQGGEQIASLRREIGSDAQGNDVVCHRRDFRLRGMAPATKLRHPHGVRSSEPGSLIFRCCGSSPAANPDWTWASRSVAFRAEQRRRPLAGARMRTTR